MSTQEWINKYPGDPEALRDALVVEIERKQRSLETMAGEVLNRNQWIAQLGTEVGLLRGLIQELFDFTQPTNDAAKFLALPSVMVESGWWKRARAALDGTPGD